MRAVRMPTKRRGGEELLTHSKDVNTQTLEHMASSMGIVLGLAVRHQNHQLGCLWTETCSGLQVLLQHVGQGQALSTVSTECWCPHELSLPTRDGCTSHWPLALPTRAVLAPSGCGCPEGRDAPLLPSQAPETQGLAPHTLLLQDAQGEWGSGKELCYGGMVCLGETP